MNGWIEWDGMDGRAWRRGWLSGEVGPPGLGLAEWRGGGGRDNLLVMELNTGAVSSSGTSGCFVPCSACCFEDE